ncbi:hypothetical protein U713_16055 [Rhodobacter capsulatus YW2]|nr:hypothetical protein U713_16055 [Rhodobacter capsulatus YW2]
MRHQIGAQVAAAFQHLGYQIFSAFNAKHLQCTGRDLFDQINTGFI